MEKETESKSKELNSTTNLESKEELQEKLWNTNFILLMQGQVVSIFGDTVYDIALRFLILAKTGSVALMGSLMAASIIPRIFISPLAGTFIDRHDRRKVLIISDSICGITILFVGVAAIMGFIQIWMVLVAGIILDVCGCFFNPTTSSSIPDIVPKSKLIKANSIYSSITSANDMAGYALGGFLIQLIGAPILLLFNGVSFLFSAISEYFITIPEVKSYTEKLSFIEDMKSGVKFVKNSKGLKYLYITIAFLNFFAAMSMTLTLPLFKLHKELGVGLFGIAMAINTFGMLVGFGILSVIEIKKEIRFHVFILSGIIVSITMILYSFTLNFYLISILFFLDGLSLAVMNSFIQSSMQKYVPSNMRSKVFAFKNMLTGSLMPLGMVLAGILGEIMSMNIIIFVAYLIFFILFIYLSFVKSVKEIINM
ncbi:Predicted arabinose efflux permease, MFS family [Clostridium cavendishii DSM 21758]|uniref:Predicted arabinose efflux permease, MFS family n=1 Tax=Clostridium cavendishii DSM 21758 TaxID=1121302 RepID=A0A1M6F7J3_9CLOT|nr:MFS transporter [Clostridium cavendishii]SHI93622.1 Predicted arabinose efflux permease, MFS family [Clostridium cavendishii DSM 21758]